MVLEVGKKSESEMMTQAESTVPLQIQAENLIPLNVHPTSSFPLVQDLKSLARKTTKGKVVVNVEIFRACRIVLSVAKAFLFAHLSHDKEDVAIGAFAACRIKGSALDLLEEKCCTII
eukprot:scaffold33557_cov119-Skeletonema_dohrnii-CCMP3373.AAC.8